MSLFDVKQHQMRCSKGDLRRIYTINQVNGQLIATFKHVPQPGRGTEIFIKKMPRDILLQEILEFVIQCGDVYRIRLLMEFSGYNRGYCFVTYFDPGSARKAVITLNGSNIRTKCPVIVKISFDNNKLEMRGVPRGIGREDIYNTLMPIVGTGLKCVITFEQKKGRPTKNCVLKYDTHRNALEARRKLYPRCKLFGKTIASDWAVPKEVLNCTRLFFKNVPPNISKVQIYDDVTKYVKPESLLNMFLHDGIGYLLFISGPIAFEAYISLRAKKICGEYFQFSFTKFYSHLPDEEDLATEDENFEQQVIDSDNFNDADSSQFFTYTRDSSKDSASSTDEKLSTMNSVNSVLSLTDNNSTTSVESQTQSSNTRTDPRDSLNDSSLSADENFYTIKSADNILPPTYNTTYADKSQSFNIRRDPRDKSKYSSLPEVKNLPVIKSANNNIFPPIYDNNNTSADKIQPSYIRSDSRVSTKYNSLSAAGQFSTIIPATNNVLPPTYDTTFVDRTQSFNIRGDPRVSSKYSLSADGQSSQKISSTNELPPIYNNTSVNRAADNTAWGSEYNTSSDDTWPMHTGSTVSEHDFPGAQYTMDYTMDTIPAWDYYNSSANDISNWALQTGSTATESIPTWAYNSSSDDTSQWAVQAGSVAMETTATWGYTSASGDPTSFWSIPAVQTGYYSEFQAVEDNMVPLENLNLMNYTVPLVIVPPPIETMPGPYNEAEVIHDCVSQYINFNHATRHWIYASPNEMLVPCLSSANVVRVFPTINHTQYDLTLVQVTRGL